MSWLDGILILVLIISLGVGARLGSLWTGACLAGGFCGAFLVDMYALSLSGLMGAFPGSVSISTAALFIAGCAALLVPGYLLSRLSAGLFLGIVDSAFGLLTGGIAGVCAVALAALFIVPLFPRIERTRPWKKSILVRPLHHALEEAVTTSHFRFPTTGERLQKKAVQTLTPIAREAGSDIKDAASRMVHEIKKH